MSTVLPGGARCAPIDSGIASSVQSAAGVQSHGAAAFRVTPYECFGRGGRPLSAS